MAYALSPAEQAACRGDWGEFYRLWTLKESWCKREDSPLYPPREVVTPPPCPHRSYTGPGWPGGGVLLWNTAGGCPLDGAGGDALKVS